MLQRRADAQARRLECGGVVDGVEPRVELGDVVRLEQVLSPAGSDEAKDVAVL